MPIRLAIDDLHVAYEGRVALSGVDLDLTAPATVAVIGPNGSGKSTLLRAVAGVAPVTKGRVDLHGASCALVLQSTDVDRSVPITVLDTVRMARYPVRGLLRRFGRDDHRAVESSLERLGVADLARRQLHDLSGGQRQRVLVAQGLAQEADILLLDEPANGVDVDSRRLIEAAIADERAAGRIVLHSTHSFDDAQRADLAVLVATEVVAVGRPDDALAEEHLRRAFGGRVTTTPSGLVLDDPHHGH